ncbi:MAG: hypothetical protein AB2L20_11875 [Mangrovibacterium sp.]
MRNDQEINSTIEKIEARLAEKAINRYVNAPVKQGYQKAIDVLKSKETDITKAGLDKLKSIQSRAIVALAIDYLIGDTTEVILLNVPLKNK